MQRGSNDKRSEPQNANSESVTNHTGPASENPDHGDETHSIVKDTLSSVWIEKYCVPPVASEPRCFSR